MKYFLIAIAYQLPDQSTPFPALGPTKIKSFYQEAEEFPTQESIKKDIAAKELTADAAEPGRFTLVAISEVPATFRNFETPTPNDLPAT